MAREVEGTGGGGAPFAKFKNIGDTLVGCFAGSTVRQQQKYDPNSTGPRELLWKDADKTVPFKEEIMWFIAMPGTTAGVGPRDELTVIAPEAEVRTAIKGFKWGQVIEARKGLPVYGKVKAGKPASGDVYTITLAGYSSACDNATKAKADGFTVVNDRIVMTDEAGHEKWVLWRLRNQQNTNAAADYTFAVRRPTAEESHYEALADDLFDSAPWANGVSSDAPATASAVADDDSDVGF